MVEDKKFLVEEIKNNEKISDTLITATMFLGSLGFLIVGISSYLNIELIGFLNAKEILFFPQGLTMCFYGITGLVISTYQVRN